MRRVLPSLLLGCLLLLLCGHALAQQEGVTLTATRGDGDSAAVAWTPYGGDGFEYYRVIVCDDTQYDGSSCSGTVFRSDAIYDVNDTGPVKVPGLYADTGYGVILQVWRTGGVLKLHATLPALVTLPPTPVTVTATRSDGGDSAIVAWTPYDGGDFEYYRVIVCDDTQYDGSSCSGTVFQSDAIYDVNDTGPVKVAGLYADTGYGVILQVWRTGGVLKLHATLPALVTLPPTPVTVTATRSDGGDSATVAWTPYGGGDFDYYRVIVCDDTQYDGSSCSGTVFRSDAIYDANDTGPVKVSGLYADTGYGVILQVWRRTGGALKLHATLPPLATPPAAPTGLTAAAGIGSITLSWNDPDDSTITGYEYQLNHTATSTGNLSGWGDWIAIPDSGASTTAYTLTGLESGEEYRFHVRAVNAGGAGTAAPNAYPWYVAATPQAPPALPPLATPPAAPTGLTAAAGIGSITLSWNDPDDSTITGYEYQLNHTATSTGNFSGWGDWIAIPDSGASTTAYTLTGLESGEEYRFHVRAVNAGGAGTAAPNAYPWYVAATPQAPPALPPLATPPAAPTGLTAAAGIGSIALSWNDPDDSTITGYEYQLNHTATSTGNLSGWGDWIAIPDSGASTTAYTLTGLESGEEYRFHVRAVNAGGAGTAAPNAHPWYVAATPKGAPSAPTGITVDVDLNVMTVGWNAVTGADGYDVRTRTGSADWVVVASAVTATAVAVSILEIPDYTGVRARAGNAASAWTDASRLPPPDVFDPPSGDTGAQAQGGQAQNTLPAPANVQVERWNGGPRATIHSKDYLTIRWDARTRRHRLPHRVRLERRRAVRLRQLAQVRQRRLCLEGARHLRRHGRRDRPLPRRPKGRQQHRQLGGDDLRRRLPILRHRAGRERRHAGELERAR